MGRKTEGSLDPRLLADGTRAFHLRFQVNGEREPVVLHERADCPCGCGGGWDEPAARTELGNMLARVRAGVWERPKPPETISGFGEDGVPLYSEYSEWWLKAKITGLIGDHPISKNTKADYENSLRHLDGFFGRYPLDEIDGDLNLKYKAQLLSTSKEQSEAIEAGADLRDRQGRRLRPLGLAQIAKILSVHRAILDEAVEDRHVDHNTARSRRMKIKVPKPKRTFLEMDELAYLGAAAADQDAAMLTGPAPEGAGATATAVVELAREGLPVTQIAAELDLRKQSITYHLRRFGAEIGRGYVGRRAVCEILGRTGLRVGELTALKIGDVRVHDPASARLRVLDSKSEAGVRVVEMSPVAVEVVVAHIARLERLGLPTGPDDYLIPNLSGGRLTRKRVGQIVREAARLASERLRAKGLPPLPHTTPHTLRRTYISIALVANEFDVKFVMDQVGHSDSTMTMEVYAQMEKRVKRTHGTSFDRMVREAQEHVKALPVKHPEGGRSRRPVAGRSARRKAGRKRGSAARAGV